MKYSEREPLVPSNLDEGQEVDGVEEEAATEEENDVIHVEWAGFI
jgi:hypothetical protein